MFTKQEKGFKILNDLNFFMFLCLSSYKIIYDNESHYSMLFWYLFIYMFLHIFKYVEKHWLNWFAEINEIIFYIFQFKFTWNL